MFSIDLILSAMVLKFANPTNSYYYVEIWFCLSWSEVGHPDSFRLFFRDLILSDTVLVTLLVFSLASIKLDYFLEIWFCRTWCWSPCLSSLLPGSFTSFMRYIRYWNQSFLGSSVKYYLSIRANFRFFLLFGLGQILLILMSKLLLFFFLCLFRILIIKI